MSGSIVMAPRILKEYRQLDSRLLEVVDLCLEEWPVPRCIVSSIWRSEGENVTVGAASRIHVVGPPYRAIDLSGRNLGVTDDKRWKACQRVGAIVNGMWEYDPERPGKVVAYVKRHGTGAHVHLQIHPRTAERRGDLNV